MLVKDKRTITDGERSIDLMHMENLEHANDMLIAWLPKEKIVVEADLYNPAPAGQPQPPANAQNMNFLYNLERWGISPDTIVSIHTGEPPVPSRSGAWSPSSCARRRTADWRPRG